MKQKISIIVLMLFCFTSLVFAASDVVKFNNPTCPVLGDKIDGKTHIIYKGIRYELCCMACVKEFKNNPDKYLPKLNNNGVIKELNNEVCPVTGKKTTNKNFVIYNGDKINLCSFKCIALFNKDKEQYLKKIKG